MRRAALPDPDLLKAANINPVTGLAADYLNHVNEIDVIIASLADMPEMREPVLEWRPVDYAAHFRITGFRDRDLAVAAHDSSPPAVKERFMTARREVEFAIAEVQHLMQAAPKASAQLASRAPEIFAAIARLGCVINGGRAQATDTQSKVESLFS
ncbi:MAG: hypothetical protein ABL956_11905 [Hyphomonadaceae bacterium]